MNERSILININLSFNFYLKIAEEKKNTQKKIDEGASDLMET